MDDRFAKLRKTLEEAVLSGRGETEPTLRQNAAAGRSMPDDLAALVNKIHHHPAHITDEEVAALRRTYSDDQLFEIMAAAALGAARDRLEAGLRALRGEGARATNSG
jgi:alkylhydroperoxidase family enzyme